MDGNKFTISKYINAIEIFRTFLLKMLLSISTFLDWQFCYFIEGTDSSPFFRGGGRAGNMEIKNVIKKRKLNLLMRRIKISTLLCSFFAICANQLFRPIEIISMISQWNLAKSIWGWTQRCILTSFKMERFAKIVNGFQSSFIFSQLSILDVLQGSLYTSFCINLELKLKLLFPHFLLKRLSIGTR